MPGARQGGFLWRAGPSLQGPERARRPSRDPWHQRPDRVCKAGVPGLRVTTDLCSTGGPAASSTKPPGAMRDGAGRVRCLQWTRRAGPGFLGAACGELPPSDQPSTPPTGHGEPGWGGRPLGRRDGPLPAPLDPPRACGAGRTEVHRAGLAGPSRWQHVGRVTSALGIRVPARLCPR